MRFEKGGFSVELWQQWTEWFTRRCNWYNFDFVQLSIEDDQGCGQIEVRVSLLGLCACFIYAHSVGPMLALALERKEEIEAAARGSVQPGASRT